MKNKLVVEKLIKYTSKLIQYTNGVGYEEFVGNMVLVEACVFNLSQMGEVANKVDKEFENLYPQIPWRTLYGLRNKIVHDYEGVNLNLIWDIISEDLESLNSVLTEVYSKIS